MQRLTHYFHYFPQDKRERILLKHIHFALSHSRDLVCVEHLDVLRFQLLPDKLVKNYFQILIYPNLFLSLHSPLKYLNQGLNKFLVHRLRQWFEALFLSNSTVPVSRLHANFQYLNREKQNNSHVFFSAL